MSKFRFVTHKKVRDKLVRPKRARGTNSMVRRLGAMASPGPPLGAAIVHWAMLSLAPPPQAILDTNLSWDNEIYGKVSVLLNGQRYIFRWMGFHNASFLIFVFLVCFL